MYYVYIAQSVEHKSQIYKGYTTDLKKRIKKHNDGDVPHTNKYRPWKIVFYLAFSNKDKAISFEKYLKSASGIAFMRKRLI